MLRAGPSWSSPRLALSTTSWRYLAEGIAVAAGDGASAVVIRLNTPGGSLDATQKIVSSVLDSPLPVIVWVAPSSVAG